MQEGIVSFYFFLNIREKKGQTFTCWQTLVCADIIAVEEKINPFWLFRINVNEKERILQEEM